MGVPNEEEVCRIEAIEHYAKVEALVKLGKKIERLQDWYVKEGESTWMLEEVIAVIDAEAGHPEQDESSDELKKLEEKVEAHLKRDRTVDSTFFYGKCEGLELVLSELRRLSTSFMRRAIYGKDGPDVCIRKVKCLQGRLKEQADKKGLALNDLVIVTTLIEPHELPTYKLEKIEGSPISFLLRRTGRVSPYESFAAFLKAHIPEGEPISEYIKLNPKSVGELIEEWRKSSQNSSCSVDWLDDARYGKYRGGTREMTSLEEHDKNCDFCKGWKEQFKKVSK